MRAPGRYNWAVGRLLWFAPALLTGALWAQSIPTMGPAVYMPPANAVAAAAIASPPSVGLRLDPAPVAALGPIGDRDRDRIQGREGIEAVGVHRTLPRGVVGLSDEGRTSRTRVSGGWQSTAAGPIWRLQIIARDANALRVHFHGFDVGQGRVWLHTANGQSVGPYSGTGLFANGDFWSDVLFGEELTVEYQPAGEAPGDGAAPFELREIAHIWQDPRAGPGGARGAGGAVGREAACHVDVTCAPEWTRTARGVGLILFERGGGTLTCSGALLNTRNQSFARYFLTAAHCLNTEQAARSAITFWGYQSATCDGSAPALADVPRTAGGARLLTTVGEYGDPKGDFTLLELFGELPSGALFLGWDPNRQPFGAEVVGIHHPAGAYKRFSSGRIVPDRIFGSPAESYALVAETEGRTEGGSSGSPMFVQPEIVAGALSFGLKIDDVCAVDPSPAGYTQFSAIYPVIEGLLEGTGEPPPPPEDPPTVLLPDREERFAFGPRPQPTLFSGANSFLVEVLADTARITLNLRADDPEVDLDLYARFEQDNSVEDSGIVSDYSSTSADGNERIVIDRASDPPLRAGTLFVSVVVFTPDVPSTGVLEVTIETDSPVEATAGGTLTPGVPASFELPRVDGPTLFTGANAYEIEVPAGAVQLDLKVSTATPGVDVDLHLSRGERPAIVNSGIDSEYDSTTLTGEELITLTPDNGLIPGQYFAALALWTENAVVQGSIQADITLQVDEPAGLQTLESGEEGRFRFEAVEKPTFFAGDDLYAVDVPPGSERLIVELETETEGVDVDLFVRLGQPLTVEDARVVANYLSEGPTGEERIVIDGESTPPLQPGRYYLGMAVFTTGREAAGRVVATAEAGTGVLLSAVTDAAAFTPGVVAPGMIVSLFGRGIGPATGVQPGLDESGRLPVFAGETIVLFDGIPAPLFFVRGDQVNAQVPYGVAGRGSVNVAVIQDLTATNQLPLRVQDAAPRFFTVSSNPAQVIALNSDQSLNSPANPARRGDFVTLFITGAGVTIPAVEEGQPAPSDELALTAAPVVVRFGDVAQTPFFAGLAPGFAGLTQINVFVPENAPVGAVTLGLTVGGFEASNAPDLAVVE